MNKVFREEHKYLIGLQEAAAKSHLLEQVLMQDSHNGPDGYLIRSLYFDTPYDQDFFEKQDGLNLRKKIRLRIYDPSQDFAMLEEKQKQGTLQLKRSLRISRADAEKIIRCDFSPLLHYKEAFAAELYSLMTSQVYRPQVIVQYRRKAFLARENNTRLTFDSQVAATESSMNLFSEKLLLNPVLDPYTVILEVKYNGFLLDYIKKLLNTIDKSTLSVSKYILARQNACQTHL